MQNIKMPYDIEVEGTLIGCLLINKNNIEKICDSVESSYFYHPIHAKLYEIIVEMNEKGLVPSYVAVQKYLESDKSFDAQSGVNIQDYMKQIISKASLLDDVYSLAKLTRDRFIRRELIEISNKVVKEASEEKDVLSSSTCIENAEKMLFNLAMHDSISTDAVHINKIIEEVKKSITSKKGGLSGVNTGFIDLNKKTSGLQKSDLIILAARPSMGKTSLALNILVNAAKDFLKKGENQGVVFFSLEMSSEQIAAKILSMETKIEGHRIRSGSIDYQKEIPILTEKASLISKLPIYIDDTAALSISALRTRARRMKKQANLGLIVVDYLQLMRGSSHHDHGNRVQEIGEISQGLKAIAKELNIPVIALSQLSRAVENRDDKRPQLSDLRESGNIEQDADVVAFIFREAYYLERKINPDNQIEDSERYQKTKNLAEIIIAKQRNGPIGTVNLYFDSNTTKFLNYDEISANSLT